MRVSITTVLLATTALPVAAHARPAETPAAAAAPADPAAESEEAQEGGIVVTARRRAENVQDVPVAI